MNEPNFYCKETGKKYYVPKYSMRFTTDGIEYIDKSTGLVAVSYDGKPIFPIEKKGDFGVSLGSSKSETKNKLVKNLRERSKNDYEKNIKDHKQDMIKRSTPQV